MSNELVVIEQGIMPVMDINQALERRKQMVTFVQKIMVQGTDFGAIPGTDKPTLLKPGAEKLATFFGLTKRFEIIERIEDWTGKDHGGEPFFYYLYRCQLYRGNLLIAEADGSCNSFEAKYRWRKSERVCPNCGQGAIIKGKAEYGGGWLCYKVKGGCGAKFKTGDQSIEGQEVGRIPNPDICDQVNTLQKMSQKRSLIAATLLAVNASEFFTQDMEDFVDAPFEEVKPAQPEQPKQDSKPVVAPPVESKKPNGNGHGKKPSHPSAVFWKKVEELKLTKEAGAGILANAGNDYEVALDRLTGVSQPPATDDDSLGFMNDPGDGGY